MALTTILEMHVAGKSTNTISVYGGCLLRLKETVLFPGSHFQRFKRRLMLSGQLGHAGANDDRKWKAYSPFKPITHEKYSCNVLALLRGLLWRDISGHLASDH